MEQIRLAKGMETLLITLYAKALDACDPKPILGDTYAAALVQRLAYDFRKLKLDQSDRLTVVVRAKQLDAWTAAFVAAHPQATVLHLGCGLDSRVLRVDPPASVRWFDVDYPAVIALRQQFFAPRAGYATIASSVTDAQWLEAVPVDRPTLLVAEGLLAYLPPREVRRLLVRVTSRFDSGEVACDVVNSFAAWTWKARRWFVAMGGVAAFVVDDPQQLCRWVPRLTLVTALPMVDAILQSPAGEHLSRGQRAGYRFVRQVPALRNMMRLMRFRF